jgi:hypothetical protein
MADSNSREGARYVSTEITDYVHRVHARRRRDFVVWGSICVILACVFALGIWFIAKR